MAVPMPTSSLRAGDVPVLTSDRLRLAPVDNRHVDAITALVGDLEVARWLSRVPHPYARKDALFFIEKVAPREISWAIELSDGRLAGVGGFAFRSQDQAVELGYWLGRPFWGQGIATEAARLMVEHAWRCGTPLIHSGYFASNDRSSNVLRKLGFQETGRSTRFNQALGSELAHVDLVAENAGIRATRQGHEPQEAQRHPRPNVSSKE